jgi:hypothetical protein
MISERDRQILKQLPGWNPADDIAAQRRAWEELAVAYNQDLPAIGALEENVELRPGLCADVAVPPDVYPRLSAGPRASVPGRTGGYDFRHSMGDRQRTSVEWRWSADRDLWRFRGREPGSQCARLERSRAALAGAGRGSLLRGLRSQGDGGAHPIDSRTSTAIEHVRFRHRRVTRGSTRKPPQSGGAAHTSTVFHYRSRRRLLVPCRLVDARPGLVSRGEPLRAARDGRNAARLHADERA